MYIPSTRKVILSYDVVFEKSFSSVLSYTSRPYAEAVAMRPTVTYTPYATSSKEQTGDVITFAQFEEGNILTETRNDAESGDKYDRKSLMMIEQDMENLDSNEKSDHDLISTEMLHDILGGSQTRPTVNKREAGYKICDCIWQKESQWKGELQATHNMGKVLLLIILFISLRFAFSQGFLIFSDNFFTSAKFLGSGMKWDTSEPDSPKVANSCKISFTIVLNTLCKTFPMLRVSCNAPFHCDSFRQIQSHIS